MKTNETTPIPQGYKATPLGIIPQEWEVKRLEDMAQCFSGGTPKAGNNEYYDGNIPFIRSGEIHQKDTELFLSKLGMVESSAKMVQKGDLLMALYGANSGDVSISQIDGAINQAILCIRPRDVLVSFLCPFLDLNKDMYIAKYLQGGQGNLSGEIVLNYKIPVPPLAEQRKIAEVLGLWDKAIEKQSQLIEQLTLRKRGLMQQLLTAKRRLPGFSGRWEDVELGEILIYEQPTPYIVRDTNYQNGYKTPVLTAGKTFILGYTNEDCGICNNIPVILFDDFTTDSRYIDFEFKVKSSATKLLRVKGNDSLYFIYCALQCLKYVVGGHERHWISKFQYLTISLPSVEEQTAIVQVLTAADREIELAQQKLELLRQQKRGLMQQLLTGKKRVKI